MASLQDKFNTAAEDVKKLTKRPSNDEMLEIYGLFKQATVGDNNTSQPWAVQLEASAKWNAWNALKGTSKDTAMEKYIEAVAKLQEKYA